MTKPLPPNDDPSRVIDRRDLKGAPKNRGSKSADSWLVAFRNALIILLLSGSATVALLFYLSRDLPSLRQLQDFSPAVATKIISRDGKIISELYTQQGY